jgi:hypothetical protein
VAAPRGKHENGEDDLIDVAGFLVVLRQWDTNRSSCVYIVTRQISAALSDYLITHCYIKYKTQTSGLSAFFQEVFVADISLQFRKCLQRLVKK